MGNLTIGYVNGYDGASSSQNTVAEAFDNITIANFGPQGYDMTIKGMSFDNSSSTELKVTQNGIDVTSAAVSGGTITSNTEGPILLGGGAFANKLTVNSGVYLYGGSYSTNRYNAVVVSADDSTIVNSGYILGAGGTGGDKLQRTGVSGASAIYVVDCDVTITNNSGAYICGGGGGGGAGGGSSSFAGWVGGGGGAGGGLGGRRYRDDDKLTTGYASGGGPNSSGDNGTTGPSAGNVPYGGGSGGEGGYLGDARVYWGGAHGGAGGGRVVPGVGGSGAGGANGGSAGGSGSSATNTTYQGGGGGGWGANGGTGYHAGGSGGASIGGVLSWSRTLTNNGTIYGSTT